MSKNGRNQTTPKNNLYILELIYLTHQQTKAVIYTNVNFQETLVKVCFQQIYNSKHCYVLENKWTENEKD